MKIFLDDIRDCPDGYTLCRTAKQAIKKIRIFRSILTEISFDHDLGGELTGYDVACSIEKLAAEGKLLVIPEWKIHSANPVGRKNITMAMLSAERFVK